MSTSTELARRDGSSVEAALERHERHERLKAKIEGLRLRIQALREGTTPRDPVDELVALLGISVNVANEALEIGQERARGIQADLYETRARASKLGDRLKEADISDLQRLVTAGLLDDEVVRKEAVERLARKRKVMPGSPAAMSDAAISGHLPCLHPECNRVVPAADGYCSEHMRSAPRTFMSPTFQARNLDDELEAARKAHATAEAAFKAAERQLRDAEAAIAKWDEHHDD